MVDFKVRLNNQEMTAIDNQGISDSPNQVNLSSSEAQLVTARF